MEFSFNPKGVCSKKMTVVVEDGKIASLKVEGGWRRQFEGHFEARGGDDARGMYQPAGWHPLQGKASSCPGQLPKLKEYLKKIEN